MEVVKAMVVQTHREMKRDNGMILRFDGHTNVIMNQDGNPRGSQNFGLVAKILREYDFVKIVLLALKSIQKAAIDH